MMNKKIKYAYFDLDGTIVGKDWKISEENIKAIYYLKNKGVKIGIATGRSHFMTQYAINELEPDLPTIVMNGGCIINNDLNVLDSNYIDFREYLSVIDIFKKNDVHFMVYTIDGIYSSKADIPFFEKIRNDVLNNRYKKTFKLVYEPNYDKFKRLNAIKILVPFETEEQKENYVTLLKDFNTFELVTSQHDLIDIFSNKTSKGKAINWIFRATEKDLEELIVFGDNENDISMFKITPNSVVLSSGSDEAKQNATYATEKPSNESGVADFIFKYL